MEQFGMEHASTGTRVSEYHHTGLIGCMAFLNPFNCTKGKKTQLPLVENNQFKTCALLFQLEYSNA